MRTEKMAVRMRWWTGAAILGWLLAGTSFADDPAPPAEHPIVLRISSEVLNSFVDSKEVERQLTVQDVILGTSVYGTAHVHGTPAVKLTDSPDKAKFWITLNGTVSSTTTGYNGPAIIHSRSVTNFSATRLVTFEPGKGFTGAPTEVSASTRTTVDGIDSTRGGLIGRIVRRRASKIEAGQHGQVEEIVRQRIAKRVQTAFDKQSDQRLAQMNETIDLRQLAQAGRVPVRGKEVNWFCCTTPRYLQIASQAGASGTPLELPLHHPENPQSAPVEIWMHDSLIAPRIATGLEFLKLEAENSQLGLTVATAVKLMNLNSEAMEKIPSLLGQKPIQLHKVRDWRVAKLEMRPKEIAQVVQVMRPELVTGSSGKSVARQPAVLAKMQPAPTTTPAIKSVQPTVPVADRPKIAHTKPSDEARTWTSGPYTAEARFVSLDGDMVRLERTTGVNTRISFDKLSAADQTWIRHYVSNPPLTAGIPSADQD